MEPKYKCGPDLASKKKTKDEAEQCENRDKVGKKDDYDTIS